MSDDLALARERRLGSEMAARALKAERDLAKAQEARREEELILSDAIRERDVLEGALAKTQGALRAAERILAPFDLSSGLNDKDTAAKTALKIIRAALPDEGER